MLWKVSPVLAVLPAVADKKRSLAAPKNFPEGGVGNWLSNVLAIWEQ
jgi:hypothetical protein